MTPAPEQRSALKEWAAVERVLAAGRSTILLRKGGIRERKEGFEVEHREFWIFPTHHHQNPRELSPEHAWALGPAVAAEVDRVRLEHYAVVTDAIRIEALETARRLTELQALTEDAIESRFRYRDRPYLHLMVLRVYRLPRPHLIPNTLDYEGCVSWVELDEALPTAGAVPVLGDPEFAAARESALDVMDP